MTDTVTKPRARSGGRAARKVLRARNDVAML